MTSIVLADDHKKVRAGMKRLLESQPDLFVIGEASNGIEAISLVDELAPDVLLLDMEMPVMNGGQVATFLKQNKYKVKILAISAYDDWHYIHGMLENGASGYITKEEVPDLLLEAVRGVARGEKGWIGSKAASKIIPKTGQYPKKKNSNAAEIWPAGDILE